MIEEKNIDYDKQRGKATHNHTLENVKVIGMVSRHKDKKIAAFLPYLLHSAGKKVAHIHSGELQSPSQSVENILYSCMDSFNGELEYAVIHLPNDLLHHYDLSNICLDSIIHTFGGDKNENDKSRGIFKNLSAKGYAMINVDDGRYIDFTDSLVDKLVITYGLSPKATITASSIEVGSSLQFTCCIQRGITTRSGVEVDPIEFPVYIPNADKADIHYVLASIGAGLVYGISTEDITKALEARNHIPKKTKYESR